MNRQPHRRYNPLIGEWVLVSPHRTKRPWQGKEESQHKDDRPEYDAECYLCPSNKRAGGFTNPKYENTFVFTNDFSALLPESNNDGISENSDLFKIENLTGECRVICFSPRHNLTLAQMDVESIRKVVDVWDEQIAELGKKYKWVQVFENRGEIMGSSNPHPHGQVWASTSLPNEASKENLNQRKYFTEKESILLVDYLEKEFEKKERIVFENEHWVVLVPFWAIWPFETMLLPKRHVQQFAQLTDEEKESLSSILKIHLTKYDNLFSTSFPYTMGWHGTPFDGEDNQHWQLHAHFYPPLLRSASVKKFMVGYEMLAEAQRDITAEQAAVKLRELSEIHFSET
ncbi:MAG: UDP-glucose--hexose-1-phosphate uridylyltransferase [Melioribacteraceae bacterium]|nr:UDP-glucose--hexose-1-phosphate uridylyltransferase [Melioribacteraceae bacterium]